MDTFEISRRTIIGAGASLPAMSLPAVGAPSPSDPIFAAMRRHREAEEKLGSVLSEEEGLQKTIPGEKRRSDYPGDGTDWFKEVRTDDPRWIDYMERSCLASREVTARAYDLLNVKPTTVAGLVTLLRYAYAYEIGGTEWPDAVGSRTQTFLGELCRHAADSIELIAARA